MGADEATYKAQQVERVSITDFELFEENIPAFKLFQEVQTQLRHIVGTQRVVPTGLDYSGVYAHLNCFYEQDQIPNLMKDLQVVEKAYVGYKHA